MMYLDQNIKGFCAKFGIDFYAFLQDFNVNTVHELTLSDFEAISEEFESDLQKLLFSPLFDKSIYKEKLAKIKLLILDVDGVLTDGGMYYTENGDQIKKFNAKDGMAILHLAEKNIEVGIISSGFFGESIKKRAEILKIKRCYVGRSPKMEILKAWCDEMKINLNQVAIIGDDINDLEVMQNVGFSACPNDAVNDVKQTVDLILNKKGGDACVREFIDEYLR